MAMLVWLPAANSRTGLVPEGLIRQSLEDVAPELSPAYGSTSAGQEQEARPIVTIVPEPHGPIRASATLSEREDKDAMPWRSSATT